MLQRSGATPTRKRNCPGINVFLLLLAGNERENRKQKLRAAPPAFAPSPRPGRARSRVCARPTARPRRARAPRASRLEPRATSPPQAGAALGVAGSVIALVSAGSCTSHTGSACEQPLGALRTQAAPGRHGPELPPVAFPS